MTTPEEQADAAGEHSSETGPLGSAVAPADDVDSGGAEPRPASGAAGPTYPPAESEPDAHR